jgi:hypothetical protein
VKICEELKTGDKYAVKIVRNDDPEYINMVK